MTEEHSIDWNAFEIKGQQLDLLFIKLLLFFEETKIMMKNLSHLC